MKHFLLFSFTVLFVFSIYGQDNQATLYGNITDADSRQLVEYVTVFIKGTNNGVSSTGQGTYSIVVPADETVTIVFTRIGYNELETTVRPTAAGKSRKVDVAMAPSESEVEIEVTESRLEEAGMIKEEVTQLKLLPTVSGNFESVLPHIALGTSGGTGGELSSQYNVRGGNYDENLVYVNDFEIYRPQLIRTGQQEGLTFPNIDLIRDLSFSSGGFEARYGDKLSSVLDIKYKRPDSTQASVGLSFLGASAHIEGSVKAGKENYNKIRYLLGARYKTTRYILGTLDVTGEYAPNFADIQAYVTYDFSKNWQIGLLGNYNRSQYNFRPQERATTLGLIDLALRLTTVFEGQEVDDFTTQMGGISMTYIPDRKKNPLFLKFLASAYQSHENERFDIIGDYLLGQIESDLGSDGFGDLVATLGTGTQHQYARNFLVTNVTNAEHKGGFEIQKDHEESNKTSSHFLQWSVKFQNERIDDKINEWERLDSAGYSLRFDTAQVLLGSVIKRNFDPLNSNRLSAYFQDTYTFKQTNRHELKISGGVRATYWDLNKELLISPRMQFLYKPLGGKKDISFRLAGGLYYQPPFYRELRGPDGTINEDLKSQKSFHLVGGLTLDFKNKTDKKFRFIAEAYYKKLWDLVSYEVDNVIIRYSGQNDSRGYAVGLDMRLNGEFVPGTESFINLSFLRTRESLDGVTHLRREVGEAEGKEVSSVPRPTDQFMTVSMFFQDYLPKNENFKMHLNLVYGTGLAFGTKDDNVVYRNTFRYSDYRRVDIGFGVLLWNESWREKRGKHPLRFTSNTWMSLEVFNLLQVANVAANTWVKTITNTQYAVPNFLTSRRINLRLKLDF